MDHVVASHFNDVAQLEGIEKQQKKKQLKTNGEERRQKGEKEDDEKEGKQGRIHNQICQARRGRRKKSKDDI